MVTGTQDDPEVEVRTLDGRLHHIVRWQDRTRAVTEEDRDAFVAGVVESASTDDAAARLRVRYADYPFPQRHPAYDRILFDDEGQSFRKGRVAGVWRGEFRVEFVRVLSIPELGASSGMPFG